MHTHTWPNAGKHTYVHTHAYAHRFTDLLERVGVGQCDGKDRQVLLIVEVGVQLGQAHNT